jgi:hypothetical protein
VQSLCLAILHENVLSVRREMVLSPTKGKKRKRKTRRKGGREEGKIPESSKKHSLFAFASRRQ